MELPYYIIGDSAYPLKSWLIKPFQEKSITATETLFNKVIIHLQVA